MWLRCGACCDDATSDGIGGDTRGECDVLHPGAVAKRSAAYGAGFSAFRAGDVAASHVALLQHVADAPRDWQAQRLLQLAAHAITAQEPRLPVPYSRDIDGWTDYESQMKGNTTNMVLSLLELQRRLLPGSRTHHRNDRRNTMAASRPDCTQQRGNRRPSLARARWRHWAERVLFGDSAPLTSDDALPHVIGKWARSRRQLGEGASSTTWVGLDEQGGLIALKAILRHDNIVSYIGSEACDGCAFIALEFMPGGSLQDVSDQFRRAIPFSSALADFGAAVRLQGLQSDGRAP
eukprot:gene48857-44115_t